MARVSESHQNGVQEGALARRGHRNAILQARVSESERRILEQLARRHGITLSEAVRSGVWRFLLSSARPGASSSERPPSG